MKKIVSKNILKEAGVLLIALLMVLSTVAVTGSTMDNNKNVTDNTTLDKKNDFALTATAAEIKKAIADGVAWLASQQNLTDPDTNPAYGSWGADCSYSGDATAITALALIKLQDYAYELGYDSPWDPDYPYFSNVLDGWWYLFTPSIPESGFPTNGIYIKKQSINMQKHVDVSTTTVFQDDPDSNGNGIGICLSDVYGYPNLYHTGIFLSALVSIGEPGIGMGRFIDFDEDGYVEPFGEIAQDVVDFIAYAQTDNGYGRGAFDYGPHDNFGARADNSVSGYVYQGLAAAEALTARPGATAFACTIPYFVKRELNYWIDNIQEHSAIPYQGNDGGSWYVYPNDGYLPNQLRTGNLIFEMKFYGDNPNSIRLQRALNFIERYWRVENVNQGWGFNYNFPDYQAMFCLMKGLTYNDITFIDTDGSGIGPRDDNWYNEVTSITPPYPDLASVVVANQDTSTTGLIGSWPWCLHSDNKRILSTVWALLALEKAAPLGGGLSLSKDAPSTSEQGSIITYTLNFGNLGVTTVHNAYIKDYIPSGTTYIDCSPPGVYHANPPSPYVDWQLGDLLPGDIGIVSFRVKVDYGDPISKIVNDAYIFSDDTFPSIASAETILIYSDNPPDEPVINGPTDGTAEVQYNYTIVSTDPDGESIFYFYDWDDGSTIEWIGPCESGEAVVVNHTWEDQGTYIIKAIAVNENNAKSDWATLEVSMPKNKAINTPFLNFLENHPHLFPLLWQLLEL